MTTICPNQFLPFLFLFAAHCPRIVYFLYHHNYFAILLYFIVSLANYTIATKCVAQAQARFQSSSLIATTERGVGEIPGNDVAYITESSVMFVGTITVKRRLKIFRILSQQLQQGPKICQSWYTRLVLRISTDRLSSSSF